MEEMHTLTPQALTDVVLRFCRRVNAAVSPVFVPIVPGPNAKVNECFPNVQAKIAVDGGGFENGWQIWEWPNVYIEAEFHSVWVSAQGDRVDVTPKPIPMDRILFVSDPSRSYAEKQGGFDASKLKHGCYFIGYVPKPTTT